MKFRGIACLLAGLLAMPVLSGCTAGTSKEKSTSLSVVTTVFPSYDFARQIAGDHAEVSLLLTPGGESHSFEPTAADVLKIQQCDVFVYVGGESEHWVEEILDSLGTDKIKVLRLFDSVNPLEEETVEGMEAGGHDDHDHAAEAHDDHDAEAEYDEHIWASPENAGKMTQVISDALVACDPANAATYQANTTAYLGELDKLDADYRAAVDKASRKTLIFGDRFPFRYLVQAYGLRYYAAFPGCSSETEASPATLSFLIDKIKAEGTPLVLYTESSTQKIAERICAATGAQSAMMHSCNNVTKDEKAAGATYLSLMQNNLTVLQQALGTDGGTAS